MDTLLRLDQEITNFIYIQQISQNAQYLLFIVAAFIVYTIPAVLIALFFRSHKDRIVSIKVFITSLLAWQVMSAIIGGFIYSSYGFRERPFIQAGFDELLFKQPAKAFPSDHASVFMAVAIAFFLYRYPKLGRFFIVAGLISSVARVAIGFHWFGDILAGWAIGLAAAGIVWVFDKHLTNAIEWIISKLSRSYGRKTY